MNLFENEIEQLSTLLNQKTVIFNVFYRIKNDKNITEFLRHLPNNAIKYSSMEHYEKYLFNTELENIHSLLNMFFETIRENPDWKKKTPEELMEPCIHFSDSNGIAIFRTFGYLPLLNALHTIMLYEDTLKEEMSADNIEMMNKRMEPLLKRKRILNINHSAFKNHYAFQQYIQYIKDERKDEMDAIQEMIPKIATQIKHDDKKVMTEKLTNIGALYWNEKQKARQKQIDMFKTIINQIIK